LSRFYAFKKRAAIMAQKLKRKNEGPAQPVDIDREHLGLVA